jgi:flagellar motor switch protein FliN/FliY
LGDEPVDHAAPDPSLGGADAQAAPAQPPNQEPDPAAETSQTLSQADLDALLQAAGDGGTEEAGAAAPTNGDKGASPDAEASRADTPASDAAQPLEWPDLADSAPTKVDPRRVTMLNDVDLRVKIQLGKTRMLVEDVLKLGEGSVVELDKLAGDPVDVFVNDRLIARGEVLVLNDNFCVRVSEVLSCDPHRISA